MTWNDAAAYCQWLSGIDGKTYRLPTEAEWEYACRAMTSTRYSSGDDYESLAAIGNVIDATMMEKIPIIEFGQSQRGTGSSTRRRSGSTSRIRSGCTTCTEMPMSGARTGTMLDTTGGRPSLPRVSGAV